MGRIINNNRKLSEEITLDDLCCEIYQGQYVLLVGGDVVLREDIEGGCNNKNFFDYHTKQYLHEEGRTIETIAEFKTAIAGFLQHEWKYDINNEMNNDLVHLMQTKCFYIRTQPKHGL